MVLLERNRMVLNAKLQRSKFFFHDDRIKHSLRLETAMQPQTTKSIMGRYGQFTELV